MSPTTKPARDIKVHVPKHNSQRLGPLGTAHVEALAKETRIRVDVRQTAHEPISPLAQAIESAGEWNSLLMTARAERGPQWDVGTQLFMVDVHSDLYYDSSPLLEYQNEGKQEGEDGPSTSNAKAEFPNSSQSQRGFSHVPPQTPQHPGQFQGSLPLQSPRNPYPNQGMGFNMGSVPPGQFYGGGHDGMPTTPMRMSMSMGGGGMAMGMPTGLDALSPDVRRRVTRGMSGEDYGMH